MSERALVPIVREALAAGASRWLPEPLRSLQSEIDEAMARIPTRLNEYGLDPFGASRPGASSRCRAGACS